MRDEGKSSPKQSPRGIRHLCVFFSDCIYYTSVPRRVYRRMGRLTRPQPRTLDFGKPGGGSLFSTKEPGRAEEGGSRKMRLNEEKSKFNGS